MPPDFREILRMTREAQRQGFAEEDILHDIQLFTDGQVTSIGQLVELATQDGAPVTPRTQRALDAPDPLSVPERLIGGARQAFQTATSGFGDDIAALAARLPGGRTPEQARTEFQEGLEEFRKEAPLGALAASGAGLLAQGAGIGAGARLAGRGVMSLLTGLAPQAARGTVEAGRAGLAGRRAAIEGGQRVPGLLGQAARTGGRAAVRGGGAGAADQALRQAGAAEGGFMERLDATLSPATVAAGAAGAVGGGVLGAVGGARRAFKTRREFMDTSPARVGQRGREIAEESGREILPPRVIREQADEMRRAVSGQFKRFEELGALDDASLRASILSNPGAKEAMEGLAKTSGREIDELWDFEHLQEVHRRILDRSRIAYNPGNSQGLVPSDGRLLRQQADEFLNAVDQRLATMTDDPDALAEARAAWREVTAVPNALEDGIRLGRGDATIDELEQVVASYADNPSATQALEQGLAHQIFEEFGERATRPELTDRTLAKLRVAFGGNDDALALFQQAVEIEGANERRLALQRLAAQLLSFKAGGTSLGGRILNP